MRLMLSITSLWPGFSRAWAAGHGDALVLAMGFGVALNGAILLTFAWPDGSRLPQWLGAGLAWLLVLSLWVWGWLRRGTERRSKQLAAAERDRFDTWFHEAQHEYLKGHWIEAETLVKRLVGSCPDDVEARLLLASIARRTRRLDEAAAMLNQLTREAPQCPWMWEIEDELAQLTALREEAASNSPKEPEIGETRRAA